MLQRVGHFIVQLLLSGGIIDEEGKELYQYGVELFLLKCVHTGIMILIGIIFFMPVQAIFFIAVYSILRKYAGGYHSSNNRNCLMTSCFIMVLSLQIIRLILLIKLSVIAMIILLLTSLSIMLIAPIDDKNKPADEIEIKVYGRKVKIFVFIFTVIGLILLFAEIRYYSPIMTAFIVELSMLLLGMRQSPRMIKLRSGVKGL